MKKIGIICEYNPFHSGHAYQIATIREREPDAAVICLMSGHATQRGELAIADKFTRAAMAVSCGADIVLELPYPYSAASAAYFAGAGVAILDALGTDELSFGSECADPILLARAAEITGNADFCERVRTRQRQGEGSAQAYFAELQQVLSDPDLRFLANDILALEYVRAIRALESSMRPMPIRREGSAYAARQTEKGRHPSATALREHLIRGELNESFGFVPEGAQKYLSDAINDQLAPVRMSNLDHLAVGYFRMHSPDSLSEIAEMQGGLANRLHMAARESTTYAEMLLAASSKSYPTARLRRAVLFALTGVTAHDLQTAPAYLSLLAAGEVGRILLREWKDASPIPIYAKFADAASVGVRQAALAAALDSLFTLAQPVPCASDLWIKRPPRMF